VIAILITRLHPLVATLGLVAGAIGAVIGWWWPVRRFVALPAAIVLALELWVFAAAGPPVLALAPLLVIGCFLLTKMFGVGHGAEQRLAWLPALALPVLAAIYLSVPDTEGAVVVSAAIVPVGAFAWHAQWRGPAASIVCWCVALIAGAAAAAGLAAPGSVGRFSWSGWWVAKVALVAIEATLLGIAARDFRSSEPVRPPP